MSLADSELASLPGRGPAPGGVGESPSRGDGAAAPPAAAGRELAATRIEAFLSGRDPEVVFFFGYGDGAHAEALRRRTRAQVLVLAAGGEAAASDAGARVFATPGALVEAAVAITDLAGREVLVGAVPECRQADPRGFALFVETVRRVLEDARIRKATVSRTAGAWVRHLATNLPRLESLVPFDVLAGGFTGLPGIVIGAGPSLDRNLAALRALQGRAVLCAVSTALPALARAGIEPELAVVIEANDHSAHFAGVPGLGRMTLLADPQGHPAHLALPAGRSLAVAMEGTAAGDWLARAHGCRPLATGGSVACLALSALHRLGCDPLVLAGMDLALSDGRTHADGSTQGSRRIHYDADSRRICFSSAERPAGGSWPGELVEAWGGDGQVPTRPVLSSYRLWFGCAAETWAADRRLVNGTGGGARIRGFEEVALADWEPSVARPFEGPRARLDRLLGEAVAPGPGALRREVAGELAAVAAAGAAAAEVARLAGQALADLESGRHGRLARALPLLAAAEARLGELTRRTRLLNALAGERAHEAARGQGRPPAGDRLAATAWSLRQGARLGGAVADGARELAALFGPVAPGGPGRR